ncbi:hypothetical protein [Candidatus Berkiella aquae]|uniref:Uncharacterized protein n=1 Tax=Candidatus Berkiella aquae TaxID=295108 RepID=A0A0Q9YQ44_9GAMM|nr:hypothetical protein [Candidatus Berkiella aquae]MCS5711650.1 hypothetical protein [Candidatus Berkiella aquae]
MATVKLSKNNEYMSMVFIIEKTLCFDDEWCKSIFAICLYGDIMMQSKISECSIISTDLLSLICGGYNETTQDPQFTPPSGPVIISGNGNVAGGAVIGSFPITNNTTAGTYVTADTINGVTGMGASITHRF